MADDFRGGQDAPQSLLEMSAGSGGGNSSGNQFDSWQSWAESVAAARRAATLAGFAPTASGDGGDRGGSVGNGDISSQPGMSDYYDPVTHAPKISDAETAAAQGGTSLAGLAGGFFPRYVQHNVQGYQIPSDQGGFFKAEDLFGQVGRKSMPGMGTFGMSGPSTNNWRLLGMGPGWIMRNGKMIDALSSGARWGGPASYTPNMGNSGEQSMPANGIALGTGSAMGVPNLHQAGLGFPVSWGWPGADQ